MAHLDVLADVLVVVGRHFVVHVLPADHLQPAVVALEAVLYGRKYRSITLDRTSEEGEPVGIDEAERAIRDHDGEVERTYRVVVIRTVNGRYRGRIRAMKRRGDQCTVVGPIRQFVQ